MSRFELTAEEMKLFIQEGYEQLELMEHGLLSFENDPDNPDVVREIFRAAHTLKGGAGTAGFHDMERLTHVVESLLDQVRAGTRPVTAHLIDHLLESVDVLRKALEAIESEGNSDAIDVNPLCDRLTTLLGEIPGPEKDQQPDTVSSHPQQEDEPSGQRVVPGDDPHAQGKPIRWVIQTTKTSLMPAVRLYQALLTLEEAGEITETSPSVEELEQSDGEHDRLEVVVAMEAVPEQVESTIRGISDIDDVIWQPLGEETDPDHASEDADAAETPVEVNEAPASVVDNVTDPNDTAAPHDVQSVNRASAGSLGQTVRVDVDLLDRLMNLVGELVIDRTRLARLASLDASVEQLQEELEQVSGQLSRITTDLQDSIMSARMLPVDILFRKFPRMIRDVSRQLGKKVHFEVSGGETELDRSVIEQIGDPLMHLLRNAVDHGLESPDARVRAGKAPEGTVSLTAYHRENHIFIEVRDDGKGIEPEAVRARAIEKGLITEEEAGKMSRQEAIELVLLPGFSTAGEVSAISGRGVGLDVVRKNIERVSGHVTVDSVVGQGTTWRIKLPLTLAIVQALLVDIAQGTYAIPISNVVEALRIRPDEVETAHGWPMLRVRDEVMPLLDPGDLWGADHHVVTREDVPLPVVVLQAGFSPLAIMVDELLGEQEVVIKSLDALVGQVPGISGASILGDGRVALIIDVSGLTKEVRHYAAFRQRTASRTRH